jgi:serine/threonine protein kinase
MNRPSDSHDEISRLADAIDAFLEHRRAPDESATMFLDRHQEVGEYLAPMLAAADAEPPAAPSAPKTVGPYRIVRELGRGGMGVVYEAEQDRLRRRIALKVLPPLATLSPRRIERFLREAKSAARLDHPGIARIFDAGEADGTWYIAMELVEGRPLRDAFATIRSACERDPRRLGREPQLGIPTAANWHAEVAELGAQVADALQHAHEHGVLHRDVKPQNIVLDRDGRPRLVDFGLAKDLTEFSLSASDEFAGTPHYVSPEQANPDGRELDARSDLFSLGVVLYELLAMRRPFDGPSTETVLRAVLADEPRPLRFFDPSLPRDLENVVGKALRKNRDERYASALDLAADLRRFRRGEPVQARPVPWPRRAWRHAQRHRGQALTWALAFLLFVIAPTVAAVLLEGARKETVRQRDRADANLGYAWQAVDRMLTRVAEHDLPDLPELGTLRRALLEDARAFHEHLLAAADGAPGIALQTARAHGRVGRILIELGEDAAAVPAFDAAVDRLRALAARADAGETPRFDLALVLAERGVAGIRLGARDAGLADAEAALGILAAIPANSPIRAEASLQAARIELRLADALRLLEPGRSAQHRERALAAFADHEATVQADPDLCCARAEARLLGAIEDLDAGRTEAVGAALAAAEDDLVRARGLADEAPRPRRLAARALQVRARHAELGGAVAEAEALRREALAARAGLAARYPSATSYRFEAAFAAEDLGRFLLRHGRDAEVDALLKDAVAGFREVLDRAPEHRQARHYLGTTLTTFAGLLARGGGEPAGVEAAYAEAEQTLAEASARAPDAAYHRSALGAARSNHALWLSRRDPARAQQLAEQAIADQEAALAAEPGRPSYRGYLVNHRQVAIDACLRQGDHVGAAEHADGLLAIPGIGPAERIGAAAAFATCAFAVRRHPHWATGYDERAVELLAALGREDPDRLRAALEDPRLARLAEDPRLTEFRR